MKASKFSEAQNAFVLNLADIEPLFGIVTVARELKIEIKIFGGASCDIECCR